jgi:hypothetical protein
MLIFGGRFQPFHIGHFSIVQSLIERFSENIVLGIIAPDPERNFPGDERNWVRFTRDKNPLSYWERLEIIQQSLAQHSSRIIGVVPLPRPSVNFQRANNYLPPKPRIFVLCQKWGDEVEQWKGEAYRGHGEQLHFVDFGHLSPIAQLASGELIRSLMRLENPAWRLFVAPSAAKLLENKALWRKMTAQLTVEKANAYLAGFFSNERLGSLLHQLVEPQDEAKSRMQRLTQPVLSLDEGLSLLGRLLNNVGNSGFSAVNIEQHIYMKDQYSAGQVIGGFGKSVSLRDVNVQQLAQDLQSSPGFSKLAEELEQLCLVLKQKATTIDHSVVVGEVASASKSAKTGDGASMVEHLRRAGSWALGVAKEIGTSVASEAIRKSCGF